MQEERLTEVAPVDTPVSEVPNRRARSTALADESASLVGRGPGRLEVFWTMHNLCCLRRGQYGQDREERDSKHSVRMWILHKTSSANRYEAETRRRRVAVRGTGH